MLPYSRWKGWSERIRGFTWVWHAVVMGTGAISSLLHNFPYSQSKILSFMSLAFFFLNLTIFAFVCTCTVLRYWRHRELWLQVMSHPVHSAYFACFPMGKVVLINSALSFNQELGVGGRPLLYALWVLWWFNCVMSYVTTFGMIYVMMVWQNHALSRMTAVWLLPVVTLVVGSSVGGLLAVALKSDSHTLALLTTAFSMTMVLIGLTLSMMIITIYLMRLVIHGPPDSSLVFSPFLVLGPLAQGGYSLLVNGSLLSELIPAHVGPTFPQLQLAGQMIFAACFCGAYILFSMAIAWIILAGCSIGRTIRYSTIPFSMSFWGLIFPNGVFAQLLLQFASVLDSPFFRGFGTAWSCITFGLWMFVFIRTVPTFIDGTIFEPTDLYEDTSSPDTPILEDTKTERHFRLRDL